MARIDKGLVILVGRDRENPRTHREAFEITDGAVTVRKEKFDGDSKNAVQSFIEEYGSLSEKEQREILIELSLKWAKKETVNGGYQNVRK